ncbi:MAG: hypothetical protein ACKV2Q_04435 [Planctomycetaceae bacterium]
MIDSLIEKSHAAREQLLLQYGGVAGLFDKLEEMDRQRLASKSAKAKRVVRTAKTSKTTTAKKAQTH